MDWKELQGIVEGDRRETNIVETMELGGVFLPLIKLKGYNLFLWGMGVNFDSILLYLKSNDMIVKGIICPDAKREAYDGIPVIIPDELKKYDVQKTFVIVTNPDFFYDDKHNCSSRVIRCAAWIFNVTKINSAGLKYNPVVRRYKQSKLIKALEENGIRNYYFPKIKEYREICVENSAIFYNAISYYKSHLDEMKKIYDMLYDKISKETMVEFIRAYLQCGLYKGRECDGRNKYFAGYGRGENMEFLYEHKKDEVWVNCGASVGDSILLYLADGYSAKRIYAFEGSKTVYKVLCRNVERLPVELKKIVIPVNKLISEGTNWSSDIREKITLINADIEGYEIELLHSMKNRIKADRPVIAICVYHRKEDLIEIMRFLDETVEGYKFLLRKYPSLIMNSTRTNELVLYAVPQERVYIDKRQKRNLS